MHSIDTPKTLYCHSVRVRVYIMACHRLGNYQNQQQYICSISHRIRPWFCLNGFMSFTIITHIRQGCFTDPVTLAFPAKYVKDIIVLTITHVMCRKKDLVFRGGWGVGVGVGVGGGGWGWGGGGWGGWGVGGVGGGGGGGWSRWRANENRNLCLTWKIANPVDPWRNNNVIVTLKRRRDVVLTKWWRNYHVMCPLGIQMWSWEYNISSKITVDLSSFDVT